MKSFLSRKFLSLRLAALVLMTTQAVQAQLPSFEEGVWLSYFAHSTGKVVQVKISKDADITVSPVTKKGEAKPYLNFPFKFSIRQKMPNGKTRALKFDPTSLKSKSDKTDSLKSVVITGEAGKGVTFEMSVEVTRAGVKLGGRVTGAGEEKHGPLSFHYQTRLNHFRGNLIQRLKGDQKKFDEIVGKDWFELTRWDKKKVKHHLTDLFEKGTDAELNGETGVMKVEVQAAIVDKNNRMLEFEATKGSAIWFMKNKGGPYHERYFFSWSADQEKDEKGEARLIFEIKEL
ncbi:hypothetical protein N9055_01165 [Akkermansiaceae bacterium]|nr:hypothetical protein [Akkermansiaceae bacterium]MDB4286581.1 hypothetical protein [bacterium]MDA7629768.1 hypothetical protein [Akkermansiaceae bacterium]MDA7862291.1 hypothetical protein [Akkermansiaceae bacterium]MDB4272927.1 hypothetical protein [Akkermansiaceae bacterium]